MPFRRKLLVSGGLEKVTSDVGKYDGELEITLLVNTLILYFLT